MNIEVILVFITALSFIIMVFVVSDNKTLKEDSKYKDRHIEYLEGRNETYQEWIESLRNENIDLRSKYYRDFVHQKDNKL